MVETTGLRVPVGMHKALREYEQYARAPASSTHQRPSACTGIAVFLDFLRTRGVDAGHPQAEHLSAFVQTRTDWKPRTVRCISAAVRRSCGTCSCAACCRVTSCHDPNGSTGQQCQVPSAWEPVVERLLAAVDRNSPKGGRDRHLAARLALGLRLGDIKRLTLDHLHWSACTIEIVQNKTGEPLVLPLIEEVGAASSTTCEAGRPPVEHRHLFGTNLTPPFDPICQNDRLYRVVTGGMAGISSGTAASGPALAAPHPYHAGCSEHRRRSRSSLGCAGGTSPATTFICAKIDACASPPSIRRRVVPWPW